MSEGERERERGHTVNTQLLWQSRSASSSRCCAQRERVRERAAGEEGEDRVGPPAGFGSAVVGVLRRSDVPALLRGTTDGERREEEGKKETPGLVVVALSAGLTSHGDMNSVDPASNKLLTFNQR